MAFQLSKLAARVSVSVLTRVLEKQKVSRGVDFSLFHTVVNSPPCASRAINISARSERFSSSSASSKWRAWSRDRVSRGAFSRRRSLAVLLGTVGVSAAVLSSSAVCAMAARSPLNLDSDKSDWKEVKKELLSMSLKERREMYRTDYISLDQVPVWKHSGTASAKPLYKANDELNQKISLFRGDITKLEIDALANAANKTLLGGGGVDGAIHRGAGPLLRKECSTLGGCETGEAKITGAYGLPAKYVIHTVGPIAHGTVGETERRALRDCYYNCLRTATENQLRTVAFPCISTGVYGYPPEQAVEVALKTVREYLEDNPAQMDRVIFCVFLKSDEDLYKSRLPAYFPQDAFPKSKL
ncbi:ADP-ribose glycohydrolase MACROD1 isoform X1 [Pangasianodon hypophthalmus]|uniref:ADP-ribose glycohydrolase MACROD1 isoform X1 n=1 Tax=Pangasianodon hypophthalmus TaxID=310915 RepID=UPI000EFF7E41|nr:ADP-ribose glycohydrolase MACROD1 isoform X1 [Pangasianodon hypophthalmus]